LIHWGATNGELFPRDKIDLEYKAPATARDYAWVIGVLFLQLEEKNENATIHWTGVVDLFRLACNSRIRQRNSQRPKTRIY
jgi:hypothetical protein